MNLLIVKKKLFNHNQITISPTALMAKYIFGSKIFHSHYHFYKICVYSDLVPVQNTVLDTVATWNMEWKVSFQVE